MSLNRRRVIRRLAVGLGALFTRNKVAFAGDAPAISPKSKQETAQAECYPRRAISGCVGGYIRPGTIEIVHRRFDLVVVGGGISGLCAAISAARNGVQVALVHERSTLGGNSSSEVRLYPEDTCVFNTWCRESGILGEIYTEERARNWIPCSEGMMNSEWDLVLYEWAQREKTLTLFLNTTMREVEMADESRILAIHAAQLGTEKQFVLQAPLFIDCTGDGVLIHRSGAGFRCGKEARSEYGELLAPAQPSDAVMGNSLFFRAYDTGHPVPFKRPDWASEFRTEADLLTFQGVDDRYHRSFDAGYWWIEVGYPMDWIRDNEAIRDVLLRQLLGVWDHIKNRCTDGDVRERARNYALEFIGFWPYKRESRRLLGDYVLCEQDVRNPSAHPDDIAYGLWGIDIHAPGGILKRDGPPVTFLDAEFEERGTMPYGIPLRSCFSKNVVNLLVAGRPISASYVAFASSRVLPTGAITGQGVGAAAALCKKYGCGPREVSETHANELQQLLLRQDCSIPGVENCDPSDIARTGSVTVSSEALMRFPEGHEFISAEFPLAQIFPVSSDRLEKIELMLRSSALHPLRVRLGLRKAAHVWDFRSDEDVATATALVAPDYEGYVQFFLNAPTSPGSLYYVYTERHPELAWSLYTDAEGAASAVPVGVTPAERPGGKKWKPITGGKAFTMRISPQQYPYSAMNVIRGTNRPDRWTNIWISDPDRPLPAWIEVQLPNSVEFNLIQITFDNNVNVRPSLPLFMSPDCVKNYEVAVQSAGQWRTVAVSRDNYCRQVSHTFPKVRADRLRIRINETNGSATARVYEIRVYDEPRGGEKPSGDVIYEKLLREFHPSSSETL
jgi:hypothetical protein